MRAMSSLVLLAVVAGPVAAQVVEVPGQKGKSIEFLGLKRRKAEDVLKEYQAKNPDTPVHA